MKKIMTVIVALTALVLVGCADHTEKWMDTQKQVNTDNKALAAAYFGQQSARDALILGKIQDPTALAMYSVVQGQRDAQVVGLFKFQGMERPTNGWDVGKTFVGETLPVVARWGFSYLMASDLFEALGAGMTVGGDYVTMNNNANSGGGDLDFNSSFDYNKTTTDTTYTAGDDILTDSMNESNN